MEELAARLLEEIKSFTHGDGNIHTLDNAIGSTQELLEKLHILRYKAYEQGLFKSQNPEIKEFELEMNFSANHEETEDGTGSEPSLNETLTTLPLEHIPVSKENESESPTEAEMEYHDALLPIIESNTSNPVEFDINMLLAQAKGKHVKIESFNGNYSLKEKLNFINVLFQGSSESFGTTVKQIDGFKKLEETLPTLHFLSTTYRWYEADPSILNRFLEKIVAKYG
jgi:hypothetical protein